MSLLTLETKERPQILESLSPSDEININPNAEACITEITNIPTITNTPITLSWESFRMIESGGEPFYVISTSEWTPHASGKSMGIAIMDQNRRTYFLQDDRLINCSVQRIT